MKYNIKVKVSFIDVIKSRGGRSTVKYKDKKKYNRKRKHKNNFTF